MKKLIGIALAGGLMFACAHNQDASGVNTAGIQQTPGEQATPDYQQGGASDNNGGGSAIGGTGMGNMQGSSTGPTGSGGSSSAEQGSHESSPIHKYNPDNTNPPPAPYTPDNSPSNQPAPTP
jgi:hypothetical protein